MHKFDDSLDGRAAEALYRLTLAPLENDSYEQERDYAALCEEVVTRFRAIVVEIIGVINARR